MPANSNPFTPHEGFELVGECPGSSLLRPTSRSSGRSSCFGFRATLQETKVNLARFARFARFGRFPQHGFARAWLAPSAAQVRDAGFLLVIWRRICHFGVLGGPGRPRNPLKRRGAWPLAFLHGFWAARDRPEPQNDRFLIKSLITIRSPCGSSLPLPKPCKSADSHAKPTRGSDFGCSHPAGAAQEAQARAVAERDGPRCGRCR